MKMQQQNGLMTQACHGPSRPVLSVIPLFLLGVFLIACATKPTLSPPPPAASTPRATLAPGDLIEVKFAYYPELTEALPIRPDGKISLRLVGELAAAGRTPQQLTDDLKKKYEPKIRRPEITVIVREMAPMRVYVTGEVKLPGERTFGADRGRINAFQAVMAAGGFIQETAKPSSVIVIRFDGNKRYVKQMDFKKVIEMGGEDEPFFLADNDVVFVSRTTITKLDQWVDQHVNQLIPAGIRYNYILNSKASIGYSASR